MSSNQLLNSNQLMGSNQLINSNQLLNTASIRKSSLTGSLGRAYSGHLLSLNSEEDVAMVTKLSNGKSIYMSQLATAAAAAREQLKVGQGRSGFVARQNGEAPQYRTLQTQRNH